MKNLYIYILFFALVSCTEDFLERYPLSQSSAETFWTSEDNAEMWVNYLYNSLPDADCVVREIWSDNATFRPVTDGEIANGSFNETSGTLSREWDYSTIRKCLEFFENIEKVPDMTQNRKNELSGQVRFILAFKYFELITLFRDVPLITKPVTVQESDIPKSLKSDVLKYILEQLDLSINELSLSLPESQTGRITKGSALALKARVLLFNERWSEAAATAKQLMDLNVYQLHPKYNELFIRAYNNKTEEVILAFQYAENVRVNELILDLDFIPNGGYSQHLPLADLVNSYECIDGLSINESPLYDANYPFENRDPRFYDTFILPYQTFAGYYFDPLVGENVIGSPTYMNFRKYIGDKVQGEIYGYINWKLIRYAEVLLTYAEAKNEATGPENSIYDALDLIRIRAGMPVVDRAKYNTQEKLRNLIRNERRVELALEGFRYFDIIRWRIAEEVLNKALTTIEVPGVLPEKYLTTRVFDPTKHYVWPIPQSAIDLAKNLEQHPEWK